MRIHIKKTAALCLAAAALLAGSVRALPPGDEEAFAAVPIVMYHRITKQVSNPRYAITPAELEADLAYLKIRGWETVTFSDLLAYVNEGAPLPPKPVMLTFDDGESCLHRYALPLLEQYDMKAVTAVIGYTADKYSDCDPKVRYYPNLTWPQLCEMAGSGRFEVQSHTYNMHCNGPRGMRPCKGEPLEKYRARVSEDLMKMQNRTREMTGAAPTALLYPLGLYCGESEALIKELGFLSSVTCNEGVSKIYAGNPESLYKLKRYNRPHGIGREAFFAKMGII